MSTYRERREARADRLDGWADKRADTAAGLHTLNEPYRGDWAFNTQPGHIPERARVIARTERAWQHERKAQSMSARADEIRRQADHAIYSDDDDAIPRLEARIVELEAEREQCTTANADYRREHRAELKTMTPYQRNQAVPFPGYHLSNLSGNIGRQRKRLEQLRRDADRPAGTVTRRVRNRRPGPCRVCAETVEIERGFAERIDGAWSVRHFGCEEMAR